MWEPLARFQSKFSAHPVCTAMVVGIISGIVAGCVMTILAMFPNSFTISIWIIAIILFLTVVFFFVE